MSSEAVSTSPTPSRTPLVALQVVAGLLIAAALVFFLRTGDFIILFVGLGLAVGLALATWVYGDATRLGMPATVWAVVVVLAPVLGVLAYLIVREFRPNGR